MLSFVRKKTGFENQELEELKTCIRKVPILAECLRAESDRVNREKKSRPAAASSAYTPLQDECLQEELKKKIYRLMEEEDRETSELFRCFSSMRSNDETISKLYTQIETADKREFYTNICSILDELWREKRDEERNVITLLNNLSRVQSRVGPNDPETVKLLSNVAEFYVTKGKYKRALPLYQDCLARIQRVNSVDVDGAIELTTNPLKEEIIERVNYCKRKIEEQEQKDRLGGRSKSKRNNKNKNKYFRSTRRRHYSRARGGKKFATSSSKTIKRRRKMSAKKL